jgi:hypothetical protein
MNQKQLEDLIIKAQKKLTHELAVAGISTNVLK